MSRIPYGSNRAFQGLHYVTVRWIDQNNRYRTWSSEIASWDRSLIISWVRWQTGAREVIVQNVRG